MQISHSDKASILVQALPYIQKYYGKIVVVKYGGNAMVNDELKRAVMSDIVLLSLMGIKIVLVHGGGPEINQMLQKSGKESRFVNGLRYTDAETMDIVQMVLAGKVNKDLSCLITNLGGKALGLCGLDSNMICAKKLIGEQDLGFVGEITSINTEPILDALSKGYIPVIATIGSDKNSQSYNINADTAAAEIAGALQAENFILMTDIRGILTNKDDEDTLIPIVPVAKIEGLINQNIISGGMIPKVKCCACATKQGVRKTFIIDGRIMHSILIELLSDDGIGTMII